MILDPHEYLRIESHLPSIFLFGYHAVHIFIEQDGVNCKYVRRKKGGKSKGGTK